ncbi:MAG TPA: amidohydrolase family protein [Candidatus Thermoplasmatota archaeon]|nr:amidohydrolase family protein [Candidatus Thermoplasmatota archaeon]
MARCVAGDVFRPGEGWSRGWVLHDGRRVLDAGEGRPPQAPDVEGLVLPAPVDAHVHAGDRVARGIDVKGRTLAEVVAPPDGLKHRILRETPRDKLVAGMREALREAGESGARAVLDFREGGVDGVRMLREAAEGAPARAVALGRAPSWSDEEIAAVLREADGIGFPGLRDAPGDAPERAAEACGRAGKPFAIHFSEDRREDVARVVALRPAFVVHAVRCDGADLRALADAGVHVVLCPRSNALFGPLPDARRMVELGVPLALGSDNAMFHAPDVWAEARVLARAFPDVPPERWLAAATAGGARALEGAPRRSFLRRGDPAEIAVYKTPPGGPAAFLASPARLLAKG